MSLSPQDRVRRVRIRGALATVILVAWAGALGGLVRRDVIKTPAQRLAEMARRVNPGNVFYEIDRDGQRVGWASSTIDTLTDSTIHRSDTLSILQEMYADLPFGGRVQRMGERAQVMLSRGFALRRFVVDVDTNGASMRVSGFAANDTTLKYVVERGGAVGDTQVVHVPSPVLLPQTLPLATILKSNKVGQKATYHTFDPATQKTADVTVQIAAESLFVVDDSASMDMTTRRWVSALKDTVRGWQMTTTDGRSFGWIDAQGHPVASARFLGLGMLRKAYELSFENWRLENRAAKSAAAGGDNEIVTSTFIASDAKISPAKFEMLTVRLMAPSLKPFEAISPRQAASGNVLVVGREPLTAFDGTYTLPPNADFQRRFTDYLHNEPYLEASAAATLRLAITIIGKERNPRTIVQMLNRWVTDSIRREASFTTPDASRTHLDRKGDVQEHAQLMTALCRAIGIPARGVSGVLLSGGKFYYHAWTEAYLGDWVAVDPTLGQFPADAAHIRLSVGRLDRQGDLLRNLGTLHIEVIKTQ